MCLTWRGRGGEKRPDVPWREQGCLEGCDKEGVRKAAVSPRWQGTLLPGQQQAQQDPHSVRDHLGMPCSSPGVGGWSKQGHLFKT